MLYKKEQAQSFTIPGGTDGRLYPSHPAGEQTIAFVTMDGRYPEKGYSINERCTETLYVTEGAFTLTYGEESFELREGDVFMILPGTKYAITGRGSSVDVITPEWDKSQNRIIEIEQE